MPLATDPKATFDVVLKTDEDKPAESRPTFTVRHLSSREQRDASRIDQAAREIEAATQPGAALGDVQAAADTMVEKLLALLRLAVIGWRNLTDRQGKPIPFDPARIDEVLTPNEIWELYYAALSGATLTGADRKNCESPATGTPDGSADGDDAPADPDGAGPPAPAAGEKTSA